MPRGVSRYDEARLQGRLWTPRALGSQVAIWIDVSDLGTITAASGTVSAIKDVRRNGQGLTQPTTGNQLTLDPIGWGGRKPALMGNRANGAFMSITNTFTVAAGTGMFAVSTLPVSADFSILGGSIDGDCYFRWIGQPSQPDLLQAFQVDVLNASTLPASVGYHITGFDAASTATACYLDGKSETGAGATWTAANDGFFHDHFQSYWSGAFGEGIVTNGGVLKRSDRQKLEGYLAWKWGTPLAASHPYANRPPLIGV